MTRAEVPTCSIVQVYMVSAMPPAGDSHRSRFRWNRPHPDLSTEPAVPFGEVEVLVELELPPGNVTSSPDGRVFFDYHPLAKPGRFADATVFELVDGDPRPYPTTDFQHRYEGVLGMTVDSRNRLWMIEPKGLETIPLGYSGSTWSPTSSSTNMRSAPSRPGSPRT